MKMLCVLPYSILSRAKLGMYVQVSAADQVKNIINEMGCSSWNVIIGSYVEKQKVVFQCFSDEKVEVKTIAKSLPLLRRNTHKSLILSYSEDFGRISKKKKQ